MQALEPSEAQLRVFSGQEFQSTSDCCAGPGSGPREWSRTCGACSISFGQRATKVAGFAQGSCDVAALGSQGFWQGSMTRNPKPQGPRPLNPRYCLLRLKFFEGSETPLLTSATPHVQARRVSGDWCSENTCFSSECPPAWKRNSTRRQ